MNKRYDNFIFDQHGQSIPLSADEVIDVLIQQLNQLQQDKARLEKHLSLARTMLNMFGKDIAVIIDETALPD
jgi:hypothetical protein